MTESNENPLETLFDLFVYAPIGLLYEHEEVLPQLVKRGRSQVQLARLVGQMALKQNVPGKGVPTAPIGQLQMPVDLLAAAAAQVITDIGSSVGLAPPKSTEPPSDKTAGIARPAGHDREVADQGDADHRGQDDTEREPAAKRPPKLADHPEPVPADKIDRLPIARYDELTAREIIGLLDDLTVSQLARVGKYEKANRARKTVLAKIARLETEDL